MFWTIAHDDALKFAFTRVFTRPAYHLPIKVTDLIKCLFNTALHDTIHKAKPLGNLDGPELQGAFQDAYVSFSHFALAGGREMLRADNLYAALVRGMALYSPVTGGSIMRLFLSTWGECPIRFLRVPCRPSTFSSRIGRSAGTLTLIVPSPFQITKSPS